MVFADKPIIFFRDDIEIAYGGFVKDFNELRQIRLIKPVLRLKGETVLKERVDRLIGLGHNIRKREIPAGTAAHVKKAALEARLEATFYVCPVDLAAVFDECFFYLFYNRGIILLRRLKKARAVQAEFFYSFFNRAARAGSPSHFYATQPAIVM